MRLPKELDEFIFGTLGAVYRPNYEKVRTTKNADEAVTKWYLGTYFPRSFVESYSIISELLMLNTVKNALEKKDKIRILGIGSGTGGEIFGAIKALSECFKNTPKDFDIRVIDINSEALKIQKEILENIKLTPGNMGWMKELLELKPETFFDQIKRKFDNKKYDFILIWKMVNEMLRVSCSYHHRGGTVFKQIISLGEHYLKNDSGLLIISEITEPVSKNENQSEEDDFLPKIINRYFIEQIKKKTCGLRIIRPLSCAYWYSSCSVPSDCFQSRSFEVTHSGLKTFGRESDQTKISYRILGHSLFAENVLKETPRKNSYSVLAKNKFNNSNFCMEGRFEFNKNPPHLPSFNAWTGDLMDDGRL